MDHRPVSSHLLPRPCLALVLTAGAALLAPLPARASEVISAQSVTVGRGTTGNALDVTLTNTGINSDTISGFSFGVSAASSDISFTQATTATTLEPYVFGGNSLFGPTISTSTGQSLTASDAFTVIGSGTTLAPGATIGLGHLLFDVSSTASAGPVAVTFASFPTTSLSDPSAATIAITSTVNGTITITGGSVVPEPSTWVLAALAVPAVSCYYWWSRRVT